MIVLSKASFMIFVVLASCGSQRETTVTEPTDNGTRPSDAEQEQTQTPSEESAPSPPSGVCQPTDRHPPSGPPPTATSERGIVSVSYDVNPPDGGQAFRTVFSNGHVEGAHVSGTMVSPEQGRVGQECLRHIWDIALRVIQANPPSQGVPDPGPGSTGIVIDTGGGNRTVVTWTFRTEATEPDLRALQILFGEMEIGYF